MQVNAHFTATIMQAAAYCNLAVTGLCWITLSTSILAAKYGIDVGNAAPLLQQPVVESHQDRTAADWA
jgi:hypothetical protein